MAEDYRRWLKLSLLAVAATTCAVVICYFFLDRPVAEFAYRQNFARFTWLKWMTYPPPVVQTWAPLLIVALIVRRTWGAWTTWEFTLLISLLSVILADQFRESLQIVFGRDWPETWYDKNPSLIGSDAYGFHFFAGDEEFGSFPSGHATRTCALFAAWWLAFPRGRWFYVAVSLSIFTALIGMNYHFLGDVVAGAALGSLVGTWFYLLTKFPKN